MATTIVLNDMRTAPTAAARSPTEQGRRRQGNCDNDVTGCPPGVLDQLPVRCLAHIAERFARVPRRRLRLPHPFRRRLRYRRPRSPALGHR